MESEITAQTAPDLEALWDASTRGAALGEPITTGPGVYVNDGEYAYGFAIGTGAPLWEHRATRPNDVTGVEEPATAKQVLAWQDYVFAPYQVDVTDRAGGKMLDPATGDEVGGAGWFVSTRDRFRLSGYVISDETSTRYFLAVGDTGDPTGSWGGTVTLDDPSVEVPPPTLAPSVYTAYLTLDDHVWALAPGFHPPTPEEPWSANVTWRTPLPGASTSVVVDRARGRLYVGFDTGTVVALNADTGAVVATTDVGSAVTAAPAFNGSTLFVPTAGGELVALGPDLVEQWRADTGSAITEQPAVAGPGNPSGPGVSGVVFTGSADGSVHAFDAGGCLASACAALWSDDAGAAITGAPAVSLGQLYIATEDGHVMAYGLPD